MGLSGQNGILLNAKTGKGKESTTSYRKEDLGQLSDHVQWVRDNVEVEKIIPAFIGPEVGASESANPPPEVKVACLQKFQAIGEELKPVYRDVAANALPLTVGPTVAEHFSKQGIALASTGGGIELIELRKLRSK